MAFSFSRIKTAARVLLRGEAALAQTRPQPIPPITAEEVAEVKEFFPMEKFFIFGHARSGTTLLARLIRLHPEIHCNWQGHFFTRKPFLSSVVSHPRSGIWLSARSNRWNQGRDLSPMVMRAIADFIMERDARKVGKSIVGDKTPNSLSNGAAVQNAHLVYPDGRIIYIVRDGRDALISQRFRNLVEESRYLQPEDRRILTALKKDQTPFIKKERSIFTEKWLVKNATGWVKNLIETEEQGKKLYGEHFFMLRYEDLLAEPVAEMLKLWRFMSVPISDNLAESVLAEMNSNPDKAWQKSKNETFADFLPKGQAGNWQNIFTARDLEIFNGIAGEMLRKWRYAEK